MAINITKDQYKEALKTDGVLKDGDVELLRTHFDCQNCKATAPQLAALLGYNSFGPINAAIGYLGKRIARHLNISLPPRTQKSPGWWQVIAHGEPSAEGFKWKLRENFVDAMIELNLLEKDPNEESRVYPEVVPQGNNIVEESKRQITINKFERNQTARNLCIKHCGAKCLICDLDFGIMYGEIGQGFIHVHHLVGLAEIGKEYKVDPIQDLRPVCPNCHAMLHRRDPFYTIEELMEMIDDKSI